jgi:hypothetical protein
MKRTREGVDLAIARDDRGSLFTIRTQRLEAAGSPMWSEDGIVVAPSGTRQSDPSDPAPSTTMTCIPSPACAGTGVSIS